MKVQKLDIGKHSTVEDEDGTVLALTYLSYCMISCKQQAVELGSLLEGLFSKVLKGHLNTL